MMIFFGLIISTRYIRGKMKFKITIEYDGKNYSGCRYKIMYIHTRTKKAAIED